MINGHPLFIAENSLNHLVEIIKVLGTPSKEAILEMNPEYNLTNFQFPEIKAQQWKKVRSSNLIN